MLPWILIAVLTLAGLLLRLERGRVNRLGTLMSENAGIDPVTGLHEGDAARERIRLQLLAASRLGRSLHLARIALDAAQIEELGIELAHSVPQATALVRPTDTTLVLGSFHPLPATLVDDAWSQRTIESSEAHHQVDRVLGWVTEGTGW